MAVSRKDLSLPLTMAFVLRSDPFRFAFARHVPSFSVAGCSNRIKFKSYFQRILKVLKNLHMQMPEQMNLYEEIFRRMVSSTNGNIEKFPTKWEYESHRINKKCNVICIGKLLCCANIAASRW